VTLLDIVVLDDDAAVRGLAPEWAALWRRCPGATPFQHPAWLLPWWAVFGTGRPRLALLRGAGGALLALLPIYELAAEGKTLPIGAGLSDYFDALIAPDAADDAAEILLRAALHDSAVPCHLLDLPPGAAVRHARTPPGWRSRLIETEPCPVLDIGSTPARQLRKLRMSRHRSDRAGGWAMRTARADTLHETFAELIRLHAARWGERGEPGVLSDPRVRAFHAAALPGLHAAGLLRLRALRLADRVAAVIYALQVPGRMFCYLGGFDPARGFESPGTLLLGAMLEEAAAQGVTECHFLRGAEAYKYAWGARDRRNALRILEPA
jgi:CelD/BcsL family acetyltransferase involved in cellulose biosynthesis